MEAPKPVRMGYEGKAAAAQAQAGDELWEMHGAGVKLLEFCAGRSAADYERMEVLRAAVAMMLALMDGAATRLAALDAEMAARLSGVEALHRVAGTLEDSNAGETVWRFIEGSLPELVGSVAEELQRWHDG